MNPGIFMVSFFSLLALAVPVPVCFGIMAIFPHLLNQSFPVTAEAVIRSMVGGLDSFPILAIPLFMFSGSIMAKGISQKLFDFISYFIGNKRAGYPCSVIATCLFFGAISGSGAATVAAVGSISIPLLVELGYDKVFATSIATVAGGLGVIIPPSVLFVVYAANSDASIAQLFLGGFLPGCLIAFCMMVYAYYYCRKHGEDREKLIATYSKIRSKGFLFLLKDSFWALLTPVVILGSIYGGFASPTEAAGISVFYAFFVSLFMYKTIDVKSIPKMIAEAVSTYAPILLILATATAFSRVLTMMQVPQTISGAVLSTFTNKYAILFLINIVLLFAGCIFDGIPAILIFTPIFLPIAKAVDINIIHLGIIMTVNLAIGQVTPPMGINLFVASSISKIPLLKLARQCVPFLISFSIALLVITFVPWLSLCFI